MTALRFTFFLVVASSCVRGLVTPSERVDVVVIAPHPDDEVLLAAGVLRRAVARGQRVAVILVTNGDLSCDRDGYVREAESVQALSLVGVAENDIHFLGYPDGELSRLGTAPLPLLERRGPDGRCVRADWTYAAHGWLGVDEHSARTGRPAEYMAESLTGDLVALLTRFRPRDVYLPHAIDEHPDHAMTYSYFRRALDRLDVPAPRVHRGVVHAGRCWPGACDGPYDPTVGIPPLPAPLQDYEPGERLPVEAEFKFRVISMYASQTGPAPQLDWLSSFAKREEVFYPERLVRETTGRWVREPAIGQTPIDLELDFRNFPLLRLAVTSDAGLVEYEIFVSHDRVTMNVIEGWNRRRVAMWPRPYTESTALHLRVDSRPDDGDVSEWSVWGDEGFLGQAVLPPVTKVEVKPPPVWLAD